MFLYAWLHLSGYADFSLDEVKTFRKLRARRRPGHPEFCAARRRRDDHGPAGPGDRQRGRHGRWPAQDGRGALQHAGARRSSTTMSSASRATAACRRGSRWRRSAFAGHQKLDNLILIYDSNDVTLDAMAKETQSEDTAKRFEAIGFDVQTVDGQELDGVPGGLRPRAEGRQRKAAAHHRQDAHRQGDPRGRRARRRRTARAGRSSPMRRARGSACRTTHFYVAPEVTRVLRRAQEAARRELRRLAEDVRRLEGREPEARGRLAGSARTASRAHGAASKVPDAAALLAAVPAFPADTKIATRKAGQDVLQPLAAKLPLLIGGSADLYGSTLNYIGDLKAGDDDFKPEHRAGRNIRFGIREHGMCAILNGIAAHGIFRPSGATFLVFADYARPSIRLAALSHLPVVYVFTHDSVGVGEDGPTHEPVETIPRPARHPEPRRHPPGRPRGDRRRVRRRARPDRRADAARAHSAERPAARARSRSRRAGRGRSRGIHREEGDRGARPHPPVGRERAAARAQGRRVSLAPGRAS